jgi:hypothetical protein
MENFNDKLEHLQEQQSKAKELFDVKKAEMEQAKEYFIKCQGAIEFLQGEIEAEKESKDKKDNKDKK